MKMGLATRRRIQEAKADAHIQQRSSTLFFKVWCNALYLLHKYINSHESRFNLFGLLTNSTQRICLVARAELELVTLRSQSRRLPSTPHMST